MFQILFRYYGTGRITHENYVQFIRCLLLLSNSCFFYVVFFLFSFLSSSKISSPRHDALGFEYIDQSKNFVPQVCRTITFPMMWGLYLMVRKGAQGLRHSEARWEGLSNTDDKQVGDQFVISLFRCDSISQHLPMSVSGSVSE